MRRALEGVPGAPARRGGRSGHPPERPTILAVDDEAPYLRYLANLLEAAGYRVITAADGNLALAAAREHRPDLVLLDLYLGDPTGFTVCRALKGNPATGHIPVICISARRDERTRIDSLACGANDLLAKPLDPAELVLRVRNALRLRQAEDLRVRNELLQRHREDLERKNRELEAALEDVRLHSEILRNMAEGVSLVRARDATIVYANPRLEQMLGHASGGLAGRHLSEVKPRGAEGAAQFAAAVGAALRDGGQWTGEANCLRRDGSALWCRLRVTSCEHPEHGTVWVCLHEDVSERRVVEAQRALLQARLQRVEQTELIGRVAAGVAHEVRNPLHALMSLSEALCLKVRDREDCASFVKHIRSQVNRLGVLMRELLDFGRPVEPKRMRAVHADELCCIAAEHWSAHPASAAHPLRVVCPAGEAAVGVDPEKIAQALLNLLENGADHSPDGAPLEMRISCPNGVALQIEVIDAGSGIDAGLRERAFEPFFTTRRGGTGLGLSIVRRIVEDHGGSVELASSAGGAGATARITLPLAASGEAP